MPNDPKQNIKARWEEWKRRNRFGGEFSLGGHSGEAFNTANKEILLQHPEYLAKVDGKYVPWSLTAKLNTANPDAVKLYVDWSVARFRQQRKANPHSFAVSVDPSDGGGHCNSEECKQIGNGSPSDQVFYIANQVAKAIRQEFPDGNVNLYAYNEHAAVPSIPLQPNVYVAIIPYAFQRTGLTPEEFIRAWGAKTPHMSIYDYWSIPDWEQDEPSFNYKSTPGSKLRFWHNSNIEGFSSESTFSAGAIGLAWYVGSRIMWDVKTDENAILEEFYDKAFGPAKAPLKRMLERWAGGFLLIENEMALSYRDLQEAMKLANGDQAILARIADYGRYVEYLRLRHDWEVADKDHKAEAKAALVRHVWRIYPSAMIHSYRIYQLLARGDEELAQAYNVKDKNASGWQDIAPITEPEALQLIEVGANALKPQDFSVRRFSGVLTTVPQASYGVYATANATTEILVTGRTVLELQAPATLKEISFKVSIPDAGRVQVLDDKSKAIFEKSLAANEAESWAEITTALPAAGRYQIVLSTGKNDSIRFQPPLTAPLVVRSFRTPKPKPSPRLYFYVPQGQKTIAMFVLPLPPSMQPRLWDNEGKAVPFTVHDGGQVLLATVPPGQDGKVWAIDRIVAPSSTLQMLNVPQAFAFSPQTLLAPQDAFQTAH